MKDRVVTIVLSVAASFGLMKTAEEPPADKTLEVDRLIVRKELIVSDTGQPWEAGYEEHQMPRGIYAKTLSEGVAGLWVRSRLIKGELDDPFDDRFHALERNGSMRGSPGHISWNVWLDGAWRQMAIVQGEGLELSEVPREQWNGTTHPGRLRFQTFRPGHPEPLTDALIGQGMMSLGGGGYGGGGLPYPSEVLQLWGGEMRHHAVATPAAPTVVKDDGSGEHEYALIAVGPQGSRSALSKSSKAGGQATLEWDSVDGADSYIVVRDGKERTQLRAEGSRKEWLDTTAVAFRGDKAGDEREVSGMKLCWCPPGKFTMGSPRDESERRPGENQVEVALSKGFWAGKYEVTQAQWKRIVGEFPGEFTAGEGDDYPAYTVNFAEAEEFCRKLSELAHADRELPDDWEFRLPTEAQWEYACRAGTTTATAFGDSLSSTQANFQGQPYNGADEGPSLKRTAPVGSYATNPWGLCDMHGNVFEWCRDWHHARLPGGEDPDLYAAKSTAQRGDAGSYSRVRRGGCYADEGWPCRSAFRLRFEPERRHDHIGFRVVAVER